MALEDTRWDCCGVILLINAFRHDVQDARECYVCAHDWLGQYVEFEAAPHHPQPPMFVIFPPAIKPVEGSHREPAFPYRAPLSVAMGMQTGTIVAATSGWAPPGVT